MKRLIDALDRKMLVGINGYKFIVNPLTEQVPFTSAKLLKSACIQLSKRIPESTTKIVTEEDKGAILVSGVSLLTGLPFGMARWYPSGLANQISQSFKMEYTKGTLYLNGILKGDRVTILDDMVSTGGTLMALISAVLKSGATIQAVICIAEKLGYNGRQKIKDAFGIDIECILSIDVSGRLSKVIV